MNLPDVLTPIAVYWPPMLFFFYMGIDVLRRNPKKTEHRLVSLTIGCYFLMFMEEYIRYRLPLSYSAPLAAMWFSSAGIAIPGLGFHFIAKVAGMDKRMPKFLYPAVFYLPLLVIPFNIMSREKVISSQAFAATGPWKWPVYNSAYYGALTASLLICTLYWIMLYKGRARASTREHRSFFNLLILGTFLTICWIALCGYFRFDEKLPPYPYIYGGILWCFVLQLAMRKYDFLNSSHQRFEKLFHLNPAAILLIDLSGVIKEANPSARLLFDQVNLEQAGIRDLIGGEMQERIGSKRVIKELEKTLQNGDQAIEVLIDGDYVSIDNEPHVILIIRNITAQRQNQRQIAFLAYHDPLTELPNRRYFYEKLTEAIQEVKARNHRLAVVLLDLNDFKGINDQYGHEAGDEVLRNAARIVRESVGSLGMAARLGGDEFVLWIHPVSSASYARDKYVRQLETKFAQSGIQYGDVRLTIGASMGVSVYPEDGQDVNALLNSADKAMYWVKRSLKKS